MGKSFNNQEIESLINSKNNEFKEKLKNKFLDKRAERSQKLGDEQSKEIEKRI